MALTEIDGGRGRGVLRSPAEMDIGQGRGGIEGGGRGGMASVVELSIEEEEGMSQVEVRRIRGVKDWSVLILE